MRQPASVVLGFIVAAACFAKEFSSLSNRVDFRSVEPSVDPGEKGNRDY